LKEPTNCRHPIERLLAIGGNKRNTTQNKHNHIQKRLHYAHTHIHIHTHTHTHTAGNMWKHMHLITNTNTPLRTNTHIHYTHTIGWRETMLQHKLQHTATHYNTPQHTATHCNRAPAAPHKNAALSTSLLPKSPMKIGTL